MQDDIITTIKKHKKLVIAIGVLLVICVALLGFVQYRNNQPINLTTTDLRTASSEERAKAAAQMSIPIKHMPSAIDETTAKYLENQLAFILRQKYGPEAEKLTASVRQDLGYDDAGGYSMYVDVPGKDETYVAYVNISNQNGSFSCAPQDQQMDPDNSHCYNIPSVDDNAFPNG
jgi:hypothetical protein